MENVTTSNTEHLIAGRENAVDTVLADATVNGWDLLLVRRSPGRILAGSIMGATAKPETWGCLRSKGNIRTGQWYRTESEARADFTARGAK